MNKVLPIQGAVTATGNAPIVEAHRSQQQRFEQAMQQDHVTIQHKGIGQKRGSLHQQLFHPQLPKKEMADSTQAQDLATTHVTSKKLLAEPSIPEEQSGSFLTDVATRDKRGTERQKAQHLQDEEPETNTNMTPVTWPLPGREESSTSSPSPQEELPAGSDRAAGNTPTAENTSGVKLTQVTAQVIEHLDDALQVDAHKLADWLDSETETGINEITLSDEMPEASVQPLPPQVKTPGDLQLARLAPAESNRELGQLLERLAVDIYQELGRPERPPLLHLTLPALGELSIRIAHQGGELQVEIQATSEGQLLLNQGRSDLVDRLQRLYPGERVALDLFNQADSEQGSRQKRSIYDEWDADA